MKKILTLMIALFSLTAVFAQSGRGQDRFNNHDQSRGNVYRGNDRQVQSHQNDYGYRGNDRRYDDRTRQMEIDRINHDYDRRIIDYRNNRSISQYERNRRINEMERERSEKVRSFASGAAVGAIAGLIIGAIIAR